MRVVFKAIQAFFGTDSATTIILVVLGVLLFVLVIVKAIEGTVEYKKEQKKGTSAKPETNKDKTDPYIKMLRKKAPETRTEDEVFRLYIADIFGDSYGSGRFFTDKYMQTYEYTFADGIKLFYDRKNSCVKVLVNSVNNAEVLSNIQNMVEERKLFCQDVANGKKEMIVYSSRYYNDIGFMKSLIQKLGNVIVAPDMSDSFENINQSQSSNHKSVEGGESPEKNKETEI